MSGFEEMWASRWSPAIRIPLSASQKIVSDGLWPGRCMTVNVRSRSVSSSPSRSSRVTRPREPNALNATPTAPSTVTMSAGIPWRRITSWEKSSSAATLVLKSARYGPSRWSAATSAPERRTRTSSSPTWSMCWWVSTISPRSSIVRPWTASARSSSSSDLPEFGPVSTSVSGSSSIR